MRMPKICEKQIETTEEVLNLQILVSNNVKSPFWILFYLETIELSDIGNNS